MADQEPDDAVPADSSVGKQILAHAMAEEYCVLEFTELDDGDLMVADITDHLRQLERKHINNDPAEPMDLRTDTGEGNE